MDVLVNDVADKMEVRLLSPKAIEEAMRAWKEERKSDQRKNSERSNLARLRLRPTRRVALWLRSPVHDELW
jgi:site-specific DNA recombinase